MREKYETLALADLKAIAKTRGIKGISTMKKEDIINAMVELDEKESIAKSGKDEKESIAKSGNDEQKVKPVANDYNNQPVKEETEDRAQKQ